MFCSKSRECRYSLLGIGCMKCENESNFRSSYKTNADRIRSMTDGEMAELIGDNIDCSICKKKFSDRGICPGSIVNGERNCYGVWLDWLREEASDA